MTEQSTKELVVEELADRILDIFLQEEPDAIKETELVSRLRGFGRVRTLALRKLSDEGQIQRVQDPKTGTNFIQIVNLVHRNQRFTLAGVAKAERLRLAALEAEQREALKPTGQEYNGGDASFSSYRFYLEMLAAGAMKAEELPFKVASEREECPKVKRPRQWKGGSAKTAGAPARTQDTISQATRRDVEEQLGSGKAAWNTAKAQYVASLPTLAHKILHLLRRDGVRTEASLLPLAKAEEQPVPEALLKRTLQELGEAGKIRKRRERSTGRIVFDAFGKMPRRELETLLIGVMAELKNGIPVPEDTKLARRVAAFRKARRKAGAAAKAKAEAERQTESAETEQQPVAA